MERFKYKHHIGCGREGWWWMWEGCAVAAGGGTGVGWVGGERVRAGVLG